ncbi:MAG: hypothetical protein ACKV19_03395 [Verrucomicrobiales bacterium]
MRRCEPGTAARPGTTSGKGLRLKERKAYQINEALVQAGGSRAIVMRSLPAYRGKEITEEVLVAHVDTISRRGKTACMPRRRSCPCGLLDGNLGRVSMRQ